MDVHVLVAYATKYGATAEIAQRIGLVLQQRGLYTDVVSVDQVRDITPYNAIVLGSAVYIGQWRKEAVGFLRSYTNALSACPVWLFSSGPTGDGDAVELTKGWRLPAKLESVVEQIGPQSITVFHGALDTQKLNFIEKWMIKNVKAPIGDFRDWDAIEAWAKGIASELK